jgi:hypothetical protein
MQRLQTRAEHGVFGELKEVTGASSLEAKELGRARFLAGDDKPQKGMSSFVM